MSEKKKFCPIQGSIPCYEADCGWWVPDEQWEDDVMIDKGWCATREIASQLGYLRNLINEPY